MGMQQTAQSAATDGTEMAAAPSCALHTAAHLAVVLDQEGHKHRGLAPLLVGHGLKPEGGACRRRRCPPPLALPMLSAEARASLIALLRIGIALSDRVGWAATHPRSPTQTRSSNGPAAVA